MSSDHVKLFIGDDGSEHVAIDSDFFGTTLSPTCERSLIMLPCVDVGICACIERMVPLVSEFRVARSFISQTSDGEGLVCQALKGALSSIIQVG